jgi:hypothetical protein
VRLTRRFLPGWSSRSGKWLGAFACVLVVMDTLFLNCAGSLPATRLPDPRSGYEPPADAQPTLKASSAQALWSGAGQVFERRCSVCHGCYDAPCQLKLDSYSGVERGASKALVYDGSRLLESTPTRLFTDAQSVGEWRSKGFHSVLPEQNVPDPRRSVMTRMLELKQAHPLTEGLDLEKAFTFGLDREQTCSDAAHFDDYANKHPLWGMPYALPQLEAPAHAALVGWLKAGAPAGDPPQLSAAITDAIRQWEDFFNEPSLKQQLVSRYIYEHLFIASLYFKGVDEHSFFRLVRSRTPSGYAVNEIPTRRPFDNPGSGRFYYRVVLRIGAPLSKTHMPYALDAARLARYRELFLEPTYTVGALPSYDLEVASNPFRCFAALPLASRYRFLLDEAEFTMMGFIKGPVCRGQVALNVIQDRFWITFLEPDAKVMAAESELLRENKYELELPARAGSDALLLRWFRFSKQHRRYVKRKVQLLQERARTGRGVSLDVIWNGDSNNANAALTVFRHFDSATVVRGLVGAPPKTAWVVDYSQFERIHYLLVAGFDVFGNVGHQLMTRLYMDFLRMEGESNLLALLPNTRRRQLADAWYQRTPADVKEKVYDELTSFSAEPKLSYQTAAPERELYAALRTRLDKVRSRRFELGNDPASAQLKELDGAQGKNFSYMPELAFLAVEGADAATQYYSLMRESAHTNVAQLFSEQSRRLPSEDALCVVPGFLGAYPNQMFRVQRDALGDFIEQVKRLDEGGYRLLRERFGVSRASPAFWSVSDNMHDAYRKAQPLEAGLFDYNRLAP